MPANKHKRKASSHAKSRTAKNTQPPGFIASHPKYSFWLGLFLVTVSMYLLAFESQNNAMFGLAMLALIAGVAVTVFAKISLTNKSKN